MSHYRFTSAMRFLAGLLEARTGQIVAENRLWRIETALKPIVRAQGMTTLEELVARLSAGAERALIDDVINAMLNNESSFFRDMQIFDMLGRELLPSLHDAKPDRILRIWCAGCSTGQEAFSLAMLLRKEWPKWDGWRISILATDVSTSAIARARAGIFSQMDVQRGLAINDLLRWFSPEGEDWRIAEEIRRMIDFRVDNLFTPAAPSGHYDLIFCRNVLLYFSPDMRRKAFDRLAAHCRPGAHLLLGAGETVMGQTDDFTASRVLRGCYDRRGSPVALAGSTHRAA